jgi:hypothetical protein
LPDTTILIVDDELLIRMHYMSVFEEAGCSAIGTSSAEGSNRTTPQAPVRQSNRHRHQDAEKVRPMHMADREVYHLPIFAFVPVDALPLPGRAQPGFFQLAFRVLSFCYVAGDLAKWDSGPRCPSWQCVFESCRNSFGCRTGSAVRGLFGLSRLTRTVRRSCRPSLPNTYGRMPVQSEFSREHPTRRPTPAH